MAPLIAASPVVALTHLADYRAAHASGGGAYSRPFPRAACQPSDYRTAGRTNSGSFFSLTARRQRQANQHPCNDLFHVSFLVSLS